MWRRSDLKDRAKWVLKNCYWKAVLVSLILAFITGSYNSTATTRTSRMINEDRTSYGAYGMEWLSAVIGVMLVFILILGIVGIALSIFVFNPLEVNAKRFFIISRVQPADLNELGFCFKNSYMNVVKVQFLRELFTFLWSLLFIIPGVIKSYEYRMIPYILAESPDMDYQEAFRISRDMMYGEKWETFVLDLSFIGWNFLSVFTCGLLAVFYVNPYTDLTNVELYDVLKQKLFGPGNGNMNGQGPDGYGPGNAYGQDPDAYRQSTAYGQDSGMYRQNPPYGQNPDVYQENTYSQNTDKGNSDTME